MPRKKNKVEVPVLPETQKSLDEQIKAVEENAQSTDVFTFYKDEDIAGFVVTVVEKAIELSKANNFSPVAFSFTELDILLRTAIIARDRTIASNAHFDSLKRRDEHLANNFNALKSVLGKIDDMRDELANVGFEIKRNIGEDLALIDIFLKKLKTNG